MPRPVDDNLFRESTMTFGEHLEELRGTLARALVGLIAGFLIALPLADDAVRFVSRPLEKALSRVYLRKTHQELEKQAVGELTPEEWMLLSQQKLVPSTVQLDIGDVVEQLSHQGMLAGATAAASNLLLTKKQLTVTQAGRLAATLVAGSKARITTPLAKGVWQSLNESQQTRVTEIAGHDPPSEEDQSDLIRLLNELLDNPQLADAKVFQDLKSLFPDDGQRRAIKALRQTVSEQPVSEQPVSEQPEERSTRRLNRLLLAAALDQPELAPRPQVIEVRVWKPVEVSVQSLSAQEPFLILIKAALILGLILSSPWVFYQIWNFVAAGLYPQERKYVYTYLPFSVALFFAGAALAFAFVFEPVLNFLFGFNVLMNINAAPRISEWVSFVLFLPIGFGISFQLPLVMLLLERLGIVSVETFLSKWRVAVLVIFVISMFLTPADPMSMLLMGVPLTVLYFGGVALCRFMPRLHSPAGVGYDP